MYHLLEDDKKAGRRLSLDQLLKLVEEFRVSEIEVNEVEKTIHTNNRLDTHKLIVALGRGRFKKGTTQLEEIDESVRINDPKSYGMYYTPFPLYYYVGHEITWEVRGNISVGEPKETKRIVTRKIWREALKGIKIDTRNCLII